MKKNNSYRYPKTQREKVNGLRHYVFDKEKLPSVTTILDQTQSAEKRESLAKWRERVGEAEATRRVHGGPRCIRFLRNIF
jgi:genome maintenance exonuclease 1